MSSSSRTCSGSTSRSYTAVAGGRFWRSRRERAVSARSRTRSPPGLSEQARALCLGSSTMTGNQASERRHAPAVDRDGPPMAIVTQSVPCERCGRSVLVAVSPLHPPCFPHIDEQVECPEIQERRGKGEGGLL